MNSADELYRLLLRAYPEDFRARYGREMTVHFRDVRRDAAGRTADFWFSILWDVAKSASVLRLQRMRARWSRDIQPEEVTMFVMAILAMLVGGVEVVNSLLEVRYGASGGGGAYSLFVGLDGAIAGALLVAAGVALMRRTPKADTLARIAAIYCLGTFGLVLAYQPIFSIFASMLGIGFPIILLAFLYLRGRGSSHPTMA